MSSHYVIPVPASHVQAENAKEQLSELHISDDDNIGNEGVIPGSFNRLSENTFRFKYARIEEVELNKVVGTKRDTKCVEKSVLFIKGDMLVVENATKEFRESIVELFEQKFTTGLTLEQAEFSQGALRTALKSSRKLVRGKYSPARYEEPDRVTARDRKDLRQTEFYDGYGGEEVEQLKLFTGETDKRTKISFSADGRVTINKHNVDTSEQVSVFTQVYNLIVEMVDRWGSAQRDASGWGAESDE